jgi:hypothetical protein
MPVFIFYANNVSSDLKLLEKVIIKNIPIAAKIAGVKRIIQGHTHHYKHYWIEGIEYLNTGTWSPAYRDVECTQPYGKKCFAWIKPSSHSENSVRISELYEWSDKGPILVEPNKSKTENIK